MSILRPDKLVAYVRTRADVERIARLLLERLCGIGSHAVPFTCALDETGLVSWGMDPLGSNGQSGGGRTSWRQWVTDRLAVALAAARSAGARDPAQFALQRLSLDGVDVCSWAQTEDIEIEQK